MKGNETCLHDELHAKVVHQIEDGMPNEETIKSLADFYKVFGDDAHYGGCVGYSFLFYHAFSGEEG